MKVSFVIPSYNSAAWLPHAVQSAMEQTYKYVEVIVVDDGSTDSTKEYLAWAQGRYGERLKIVRNSKNKGRSASRNIGNALASGEVICVLDADDLAFPKRAELTVKKIKRGLDFVHGGAVTIDALGRGLAEITPGKVTLKQALKDMFNGIVHSSVAYTKEFATKYPYRGGTVSEFGIDDWAQQIEALPDRDWETYP